MCWAGLMVVLVVLLLMVVMMVVVLLWFCRGWKFGFPGQHQKDALDLGQTL